MTPVRWTPQALEDVAEIRAFIARDAPGYAEVVVDRIFEGVERLHEFPQSGRIVPEFEPGSCTGGAIRLSSPPERLRWAADGAAEQAEAAPEVQHEPFGGAISGRGA